MSYLKLALFLIFLACAISPLIAQNDTITANPNAVKLRRIWMVRGSVTDDNVGASVGSVGDINGNGLGDFAIFNRTDRPIGGVHIYLGDSAGPSTTPYRSFDSTRFLRSGPVAGDFWGTGHNALGLFRTRVFDDVGRYNSYLDIYRSENRTLPDSPSITWIQDFKTTKFALVVQDILAVDVDRDGDDELVLIAAATNDNGVVSMRAEVWIFDGGPNFQVDTPTVVIRDPDMNAGGNAWASISDIDGDTYPDIILRSDRFPPPFRTSIYWGAPGLPTSSRLPDRLIDGTNRISLVDCDGDGILDIVQDGLHVIYVFLSGALKSARSRSFDPVDADLTYPGLRGRDLGYLSDFGKRYPMLGVVSTSPLGSGDEMISAFSTGPQGPDRTFEAYYSPGYDGMAEGGVFFFGGPIGDVNGDGWDDVLVSDPSFPGPGINKGLAVILAGGPYLPRDSIASAIRDLPLEEHWNALSVWPNPMREELKIAWRGNLKHMPARFEVHDLLGKRVGMITAAGNGQVSMNTTGLPSGDYLLSVYSLDNVLLATTRVVKQ